MNGSKLVSVIIPTYNRNDFLIRSIKSALEQDYDPLEIVIIDDSTDRNAEGIVKCIVSENKTNKLIYYLHSTRVRQGAARNLGIRFCHGEVISFLDDDDEWLRGKTTAEMRLLERYDYKVAVFGGRTVHAKDGSSIIYIPRYHLLAKHIIKLFNFIAFPAFTFPTYFIDKIGYLDETLKTHEDWDFHNKLVLEYNLVPLKKVVARIHKHDRNRNLEESKSWLRDKLEVTERYKKYWTPLTYTLAYLRKFKMTLKGQMY